MFEFENLFLQPFEDIFNAAKAAEKVAVPMNIIRNEDGSSTVEVAVVGKSREDVSVKGVVENGKTFLLINTVEKKKTEDEKTDDETPEAEQAEDKRKYTIRKIKGTGKLSIKLLIPSTLNLNKAEVTVENGLLTVNIPAAEEAKPIEFEIK